MNKIAKCYLAKIPEMLTNVSLFCDERKIEIASITDSELKKQKIFSWQLLEKAVSEFLECEPQNINLKKTESGKWVSDKCFFSISHTKNFVAVCVSDDKIGVDIEEIDIFNEKIKKIIDEKKFISRVLSLNEQTRFNEGKTSLIEIWTNKEAIFKYGDNVFFEPKKINSIGFCKKLISRQINDVFLSICSDTHVDFYLC